jgi:nicotinate-nucleotide adenylyltransferase
MPTEVGNRAYFFGGSFDPPHLGHSTLITEIKKDARSTPLFILPTAENPLKKSGTPFLHRFEMAKIAFTSMHESIAPVLVSDLEQTIHCKSTYELLNSLGANQRDFTFCLGSDQFLNFDRWKDFRALLNLSHFRVAFRKGTELSEIETKIRDWVQGSLLQPTTQSNVFKMTNSSRTMTFCATNAQNISSTQIRELLATQPPEKCREILSSHVLNYIQRNHLYGT